MILQRYPPRNTAESTGKFPPTPTVQVVAKAVRVMKLLEPPAAVPKTAVINKVILKEILPRDSAILSADIGNVGRTFFPRCHNQLPRTKHRQKDQYIDLVSRTVLGI